MNKLLVVDDDQEIASMLCELLELEGFEVIIANNGVQALAKYDARNEWIKCIN